MEQVEERLRADVVALATPDGRMVDTPGHERARTALVARLDNVGVDPYLGDSVALPYAVDGHELCNLVGVTPGTSPDLPPVLIGAHYDTCGPLPGADDNAAAVAIALEVARRLRVAPAARSCAIALFDGEEPPHFLSGRMGSVYFYHHQRTGPVHAALVMDLVGHDVPIPGRGDLLFVTGGESDPGLPDLLTAAPAGLRIHPVLNRYVGDLSDHHVFRGHRRPYLFLTCGRWKHYHQPTDTPDKLSWSKMAAVADYLERLVRDVAEAPLDGPFDTGDTLAIETAAIRAHFGGLLGPLARIRRREGVDRFVGAAMAMFGL